MAKRDASKDLVAEARGKLKLSRRFVLGVLATAAGAPKALAEISNAIQRDRLAPTEPLQPVQSGISTLSVVYVPIIRPDDLLVLGVTLRNLRVSQGGRRQLTLINPAEPGVMVVTHQPQSVLEQTYLDPGDPTNPNAPPPLYPPPPPLTAGSRLAGPSHVAYQTPVGFTSWPFTLADLLNAFTIWPMRLDINAQPLPADPLGIASALHEYDAVKASLGSASVALKSRLASTQNKTTVRALERASRRVVAKLSDTAKQGRKVGESDMNATIASEVNTALKSRAVSASDVTLAKNYVEATVGLGVISKFGPGLTLMLQPPHPPAPDVTALEVPYQLIQSPLATAGWTHATTTVKHGQQTELWHTRLGTKVAGSVLELDGEPLRAIWTPGYTKGAMQASSSPAPSWLAPMTYTDRLKIVANTADNFLLDMERKKFVPQPSLARRLMMSAMGATLELDGAWPVRPQGVDLEAWNHRAAIGRDHFVRLVYAGYLYPFGHRASFIKVTERKFGTQRDGGRAAVLLQRYFIIVREPVKNFPGTAQAFDGRDFPFESIEIVTKVTPNLVQPVEALAIPLSYYTKDGATYDFYEGFWPHDLATSADFKFHLIGTDGAGRKIPFEMPLFFLSETKNDAAHLATVKSAYNSAPANKARRTVNMNGAKLQFAPQTVGGDSKGDTNFPVDKIVLLGADPVGGVPVTQPQFYPSLVSADVALPSVKALLGAKNNPTVSYSAIYLANSFSGPNKGQLFLDIAAPGPIASGPSNAFGGLISPNLTPSGLSRSFGAVQGAGNASTFASGIFDPTDFIPDDAKLLGSISLKKILNVVNDVASASGAVPTLNNIELPTQIQVNYTLSQKNLQPLDPLFLPDSDSELTINSQVLLSRDGSTPANATVKANINNFKVSLFGFIILHFDSLELDASSGSKTDVKPKLNDKDGVMFAGPLEFVNGLKDVIPMGGFSDPPGISVTPTGISAAYSLALPTIGVGVMTLANVSLGAGFDLPFTGDPPTARFNFAERQSPFNLTISLFGGGGFFAIAVSTKGIVEIEAALEFGAQISIDLGVASGGVYVKGGFYFHWIGATNEVDFEGYVEMGGHLSVLGIISVSLVFHLGLAYQKLPPSSKLYGEATLTVEVSVLFFSVSVDVHVERQFAGSKSDPVFLDFAGPLPSDPSTTRWSQYCDAFA